MKRILSLFAGLLVLTPVLFSQNASYTQKLNQAKEYEAAGKSFYALVSYYDAMEAEPTEKAQEALEAYLKLSDLLKSGKPVWGENLDEFDIYDGWMEIAAEYDEFWKNNSPVYFNEGSFVKGELNMETRTASYTASLSKGYTSKYLELKDIVFIGWKKAWRSDWNKGTSSSLPLTDDPENRTYYVKALVIGSSGQVLYNLEGESQADNANSELCKLSVSNVSREDMKKLDSDTVKVSISEVFWKHGDENQSYSELLKVSGDNVVNNTKYQVAIARLSKSFVLVEGGTFQMGSNVKDEKPVHSVTLSPFYMSKTEVTQAQWKAVMGENLSVFIGDDLPVDSVSWYDAIVFCNKFSMLDSKTPVYSVNGKTDPAYWNYNPCCDSSISGTIVMNKDADGYRLPTEAEWEYAARGGKYSKGYKYSGSDNLDAVAWYYDNSEHKVHEVVTKKANELGLYDMTGNLGEWCWDWYGLYSEYDVTNPSGPLSGTSWGANRLIRGGTFSSDSYYCRVASRASSSPKDRNRYKGFRLVCNAL